MQIKRIPKIILSIWSTQGAIFQQIHDIYSEIGLKKYIYWLLTHFKNDYPEHFETIEEELLSFHSYDSELELDGSTFLMETIKYFRQDINSEIVESNYKFNYWFASGGHKDYNLSNGMPRFNFLTTNNQKDLNNFPLYAKYLHQILYSKQNINNLYTLEEWYFDEGVHLVNGYLEVYRDSYFFKNSLNKSLEIWTIQEGDFKKNHNIYTEKGLKSYIYWLLCHFKDNYPNDVERIKSELLSMHSYNESLELNKLSLLMESVKEFRPDIIIDIKPEECNKKINDWFTNWGFNDYGLDNGIPIIKKINNNIIKDCNNRKNQIFNENLNIALIGYPKGEFGIGEDIRLLKKALQLVGIDSKSVRVSWNIVARENIQEDCITLNEMSNVDIAIYCMPAFDTLMLFLKEGIKYFEAKRKIGFWQWEFEDFPTEATLAFELVDEIWCHSEHSKKAFLKVESNIPIIKVPLPVDVPQINISKQNNEFTFFTSFDGASYIARKNPLATIMAFQKAFPKDTNVILNIKVMNQQNDSLWNECLRLCETDSRIRIINEILSKEEYYELLNKSDAVISLHRAEGFGRLMAEAMCYGIPVITTNYSGNLDFTKNENSWLVDGKIVKLFEGDYPFYKELYWMNPDVDKAASVLLECRNNYKVSLNKSEKGKKMMENYSLNSCGIVYKNILGGNYNVKR